MTLRTLNTALATILVLFVTGCQYQRGSIMHPQITSLGVGEFSNSSREPRVLGVFRTALAEKIMTDGSVKLQNAKEADAYLTGTISSVETKSIASAKLRTESAANDDKDEYQTSIYRATVTIEYEVRLPGRTTPLIEKRKVTGTGDFARLADMMVARREAMRIALADAADKMVSETTEAW